MASEILLKKLKGCVGENVLVFIQNGFRFEGRVLDCDDEFIVIDEIKRGTQKIIGLEQIKEIQIKNGSD